MGAASGGGPRRHPRGTLGAQLGVSWKHDGRHYGRALSKDDLRGWKLGRALFVAVASMHSEANREELARGMGKYVLAVPMSAIAEVKTEVAPPCGALSHDRSQLARPKEVVVGDGERRRRYIVCFNPREAERQAQHRSPR
jgi:hypothetical protein